MAVGRHAVISTSEDDANLLSQRHAAWAAKDSINLFTRGENKDANRPVQDVGLKLRRQWQWQACRLNLAFR